MASTLVIRAKLFVAGATALLLAACATTLPHRIEKAGDLAVDGTKFEGRATACVFRDEGTAAALWSVDVKLDGVSKGSIRRYDYVCFPAESGDHTVLMAWPTVSGLQDVAISAGFEAGKTYCFAFNTHFGSSGNLMQIAWVLGQISADAAKYRFANYTLK